MKSSQFGKLFFDTSNILQFFYTTQNILVFFAFSVTFHFLMIFIIKHNKTMKKPKLNLSDVLNTALYVSCGVIVGVIISCFSTAHAIKQELKQTTHIEQVK